MSNITKQNNFHEWKQIDKRSKWNRHWDGKHTKECHEYSLTWFGDICKYTNEFLNENTDLERLLPISQSINKIK